MNTNKKQKKFYEKTKKEQSLDEKKFYTSTLPQKVGFKSPIKKKPDQEDSFFA